MSGAVFDRSKLLKLRDEFAVKNEWGRATTSLESIEWEKLHIQTRILMLLDAGCDGELQDMAAKNWHELPRPEQLAVNLSIRRLRCELLGLVALARHV